MKNSKFRRALRRHHEERIRNKAHQKFLRTHYKFENETPSEFEERKLRFVRLNHNNLKDCSCHMCGNPHTPTLQEKRANDNMKEQVISLAYKEWEDIEDANLHCSCCNPYNDNVEEMILLAS